MFYRLKEVLKAHIYNILDNLDGSTPKNWIFFAFLSALLLTYSHTAACPQVKSPPRLSVLLFSKMNLEFAGVRWRSPMLNQLQPRFRWLKWQIWSFSVIKHKHETQNDLTERYLLFQRAVMDSVFVDFPSLVALQVLPRVTDPSPAKRMIGQLLSSIRSSGRSRRGITGNKNVLMLLDFSKLWVYEVHIHNRGGGGLCSCTPANQSKTIII